MIILDNNSIRKANDKFIQESQISFFNLQEDHNPLDIPFGHEVNEIGTAPKDVDEGGMGSGRQDEGGGDSPGSQQGPLISFGINETLTKNIMDAKIKGSCSCHKKN